MASRPYKYKKLKTYNLSSINLEFLINMVEPGWIFWELVPNVLRAHKDGLQMHPGTLNLKPYRDHLVCYTKLDLPWWYITQEVSDELGRDQVLELYLHSKQSSLVKIYQLVFKIKCDGMTTAEDSYKAGYLTDYFHEVEASKV